MYISRSLVEIKKFVGVHLPPNKHTRVPYGDNMGFNVVPIWVSPAGCVVRLLKVFYWDLYGAHQMAHKEPIWVPSVFAYGI